MQSSTPSISPLRQRMIDDMRMRKLNPKTQAHYIRSVPQFAAWLNRSPALPLPRICATTSCIPSIEKPPPSRSTRPSLDSSSSSTSPSTAASSSLRCNPSTLRADCR